MSKEIERKWILRRLPSATPIKMALGERVYLSTLPAAVRANRYESMTDGEGTSPAFRLNMKLPGGLTREEFEYGITEQEYNAIVKASGASPIYKVLRYYSLEGLCDPTLLRTPNEKLRVDQVFCSATARDSDQPDLIYAEVEFSSEENAMQFEFPFAECEAVDATGDPALQMASLWRFYRPLDPHVWLAEISKGLYSVGFDREFREKEATRRTTSPTSMSSYIDGKPYTVRDLIVSIMCHCPLDMPVSMPNTSENCIGYADLAYTEFGPPKYREKHYSVDLKTGTIPLKKDVSHTEAVVNAYRKIEEYNKEQLK